MGTNKTCEMAQKKLELLATLDALVFTIKGPNKNTTSGYILRISLNP